MRTLFLAFLSLTAALALIPGGSAEDRSDGREPHAHAFEHCAKLCSDCQRACDSCTTHCQRLLADGKKEHQTTRQTVWVAPITVPPLAAKRA